MAKYLPKSALADLLSVLAKKKTLIGPVEEEGVVVYRPAPATGVLVEFDQPVNSVKDFVFPQTEPIFSYEEKGDIVEIREPSPDEGWVLFGVRPCDLAALARLDKVFLEGYNDTYYAKRRQAGLIVGLACIEPSGTCFCNSFGITPGTSEGADIMLYPDGDGFVLTALTAKGQEALGSYAGLKDVEDDRAEGVIEGYRKIETPLSARVNLDGVSEKLDGMWDAAIWEETALRCTGCGICTYVCPTCHCFQMTDRPRGKEGVRYRCWDNCQSENFTLMAGGHNPRPSKLERIRQRFLHKLNYFPKRWGMYLCTGCGRCMAKCPVGIHVPAMVALIREYEDREAAVNE